MPNPVLVVFSEPTDGAEEDYNRWYLDQHIPEVLEIPGFVAAQRFSLSEDAQPDGFPAPQRRYLALYDIEGDPAAAVTNLLARVHEGHIRLPDCIDQSSVQAWAYDPITERITAASLTPGDGATG